MVLFFPINICIEWYDRFDAGCFAAPEESILLCWNNIIMTSNQYEIYCTSQCRDSIAEHRETFESRKILQLVFINSVWTCEMRVPFYANELRYRRLKSLHSEYF